MKEKLIKSIAKTINSDMEDEKKVGVLKNKMNELDNLNIPNNEYEYVMNEVDDVIFAIKHNEEYNKDINEERFYEETITYISEYEHEW